METLNNCLDLKIVYNNYIVQEVRQIMDIALIKTVNKSTGEIIWFIGYKHKNETMSRNIHRILGENKKFSNSYLRAIFAEDKVFTIKLDKIKFV